MICVIFRNQQLLLAITAAQERLTTLMMEAMSNLEVNVDNFAPICNAFKTVQELDTLGGPNTADQAIADIVATFSQVTSCPE